MSRMLRLTASVLAVFALGLAAPVVAQGSVPDCDRVSEVVMGAVNARVAGDTKNKTRRALRHELGRTAGDELAEWVYALPEEMLTDEVGKAWKSQCESL